MTPTLLYYIDNFICLMCMAGIVSILATKRHQEKLGKVGIVGLALLFIVCAVMNVLLAMAL